MSTAPRHIELLQPTITDADDVAGFDRPYDPIWMVYVTPLVGLLFTGLVLAYNYGRLGMPNRRIPAAIFAIVASTTLFVGAIYLAAALAVQGIVGYTGFIWIGRIALSLALCYWIARDQQRRYRIFAHSNLPKPSWRPVVILAIVYFFASNQVADSLVKYLAEVLLA